MNFTTIFKTFAQQQQKVSLTPSIPSLPSDILFVCIFGIGVSICLFFIWPECVDISVCVCVGVGVCIMYEFYMCCICRLRAAALFMRVSPVYVYLNFLVGAENERVKRANEGGKANGEDRRVKKCKRRHNNAQGIEAGDTKK